MMNCILKAVL